jgi:L-alanine-DL-glutamate epimerase-like enolase superfamily enzyme
LEESWSVERPLRFALRFRYLGVVMFEQPLPRGNVAALEDYDPPLPLYAAESCLSSRELRG